MRANQRSATKAADFITAPRRGPRTPAEVDSLSPRYDRSVRCFRCRREVTASFIERSCRADMRRTDRERQTKQSPKVMNLRRPSPAQIGWCDSQLCLPRTSRSANNRESCNKVSRFDRSSESDAASSGSTLVVAAPRPASHENTMGASDTPGAETVIVLLKNCHSRRVCEARFRSCLPVRCVNTGPSARAAISSAESGSTDGSIRRTSRTSDRGVAIL